MSPSLSRHFALQGAAAFFVLSIAWPYYGWIGEAMPWLSTSLTIGGVALLLATLARQAWWWRVLHASFMPLIWGTHELALDPGWFLLAAIVCLLAYRGLLSGQIPLALADRPTLSALGEILVARGPCRFIELGSGIGRTTIPLADALPEHHFTGYEDALPRWLIGLVLSIGHTNLRWRWDDLWQARLGDYDVVYASLSPAPMPQLWAKACAEMAPGSLLISQRFPIPGLSPERIVETEAQPSTPLYCYRIHAPQVAKNA